MENIWIINWNNIWNILLEYNTNNNIWIFGNSRYRTNVQHYTCLIDATVVKIPLTYYRNICC